MSRLAPLGAGREKRGEENPRPETTAPRGNRPSKRSDPEWPGPGRPATAEPISIMEDFLTYLLIAVIAAIFGGRAVYRFNRVGAFFAFSLLFFGIVGYGILQGA